MHMERAVVGDVQLREGDGVGENSTMVDETNRAVLREFSLEMLTEVCVQVCSR